MKMSHDLHENELTHIPAIFHHEIAAVLKLLVTKKRYKNRREIVGSLHGRDKSPLKLRDQMHHPKIACLINGSLE